jgi:hypothetical protein
MRQFIFAAALALSAVASPSWSQPASPPAAVSPDAATAARFDLAKRYFAAIHYDQLVDSMMDKMLPAMMDQATKANPSLSDKERTVIIEATTDAGKAFNHDFGREAITVIADTFSEEELTAMVNFYESAVGQSIMRKTPTMIPRLTQMAVTHMPALQADIAKRVCAKLDCSKVKLPGAKPS